MFIAKLYINFYGTQDEYYDLIYLDEYRNTVTVGCNTMDEVKDRVHELENELAMSVTVEFIFE